MLAALRRTIVRNPHLCVIVTTGLVAALIPLVVDRRDADDWTTIAYVQEFRLDDGNIRDPFFGTDFVIDSRYLINGWPRVLATLSDLSGIGPVVLVRQVLPPILVALAAATAFALYRALGGRDVWLPTMATVLLLLYFLSTAADGFERQGESFFLRMAQDKYLVAFVLVPLAASFLIRSVTDRSLLSAAAAMMVGAVAGNVHPFAPVLLAVLALPFVAAYVWDRADPAREIAIAVLIIAVSFVPAAMHMWLADTVQSNPFFDTSSLAAPTQEGLRPEQVQAALLAGSRYDRLPLGLAIANRGFVLHGMAVLAGALLPLVALRWRREVAARYSSLLFVVVLAVLYLPPVTRAAIGLLTPFQAWRASFLLPYGVAPVLAIGLRELHRLLRPKTSAWAAWSIPAALALASIVPGLALSARWQLAEGPVPLYLAPTQSERDVMQLIETNAPGGTVLATRITSRFIPSYVPRAQVVDFRDAALAFPPGVEDGWLPRRTAVTQFFAQTEVNEVALEIIRNYRVDLVVVERASPLNDALLSCSAIVFKVGESSEHALYAVRSLGHIDTPALCE